MRDATPFLRLGRFDIELRSIVGVLLVVIAFVSAAQAAFPWWAPVLVVLVVSCVELTVRRRRTA